MSKPHCFGSVTRCSICSNCGVKMECYEKQQQELSVFLLPTDRPAPKGDKPSIVRFVKEATNVRTDKKTNSAHRTT